MSRPRKKDKHLPKYVRIRHGSYLYRDEKLCRVEEGEAKMYDELAKRKRLGNLDMVPAAVAAFKLDYLQTLSASARKEHARLLTLFADEFSEFRVDEVDGPAIKRSVRNLFGNKLSAARHYKARISTFFRWAITEAALVKLNPCRDVWVKKPVARKTPWTAALFWKVRDKLGPMQQCYHDLSFLLYQRTTDIRMLKRAQDLGDVIHFEPSKTAHSSGAAVDVPVTPAIRKVLDRAAAISKEWQVVCPFVIHTRQGTPFTKSGMHSAYRRADIALHGKDGMLNLNPKALLPFAVTTAKKRGATLEQIKVGRAHASITTTEGYVQQHEVPVSEVRLELPDRPNFGQTLSILDSDSDR